MPFYAVNSSSGRPQSARWRFFFPKVHPPLPLRLKRSKLHSVAELVSAGTLPIVFARMSGVRLSADSVRGGRAARVRHQRHSL